MWRATLSSSKPRFYILCVACMHSFTDTFTSDQGDRRIRVFNQRLQVTDAYPRFFKGIDGSAVALSLARTAAFQTDTVSLLEIRENLQSTVEDMLLQYRNQCSASSSTGQLVLPENGKLLPLLLNCLLKSPLLLVNEANKRELMNVYPRGDLRAWAIQVAVREGVKDSM